MKKKLLYFIICSSILFIFIIFFKGLYENNLYQPIKNHNGKIKDFKTKDLFLNNDIYFFETIDDEKFTILNIWASWCVPCIKEHKFLTELSDEKKVNLIGLNYKDKYNNAKEFINKYGNPYNKILIDSDGTKSIELGAYGVPETFLIDSKKKIIKKYIGPIDKEKLNEIFKIIK